MSSRLVSQMEALDKGWYQMHVSAWHVQYRGVYLHLPHDFIRLRFRGNDSIMKRFSVQHNASFPPIILLVIITIVLITILLFLLFYHCC